MITPSSSPADPPKLAPPGAGLPKPELAIANVLFRWGRWRTSRAAAAENFASHREAILNRVSGLDDEAGGRRVLIRRLPGLEDSSRFWSAFMTLDHLRIVNESVARVIVSLVGGQVPSRAVRTADVKPAPDTGIETVEAFQASCLRFERRVAKELDLATAAKYAHPWFGPLDAAGWHFLAGFHMNLHRKQIDRILAA